MGNKEFVVDLGGDVADFGGDVPGPGEGVGEGTLPLGSWEWEH